VCVAQRGQWYSNPRGHVAAVEKRSVESTDKKRAPLSMSIPTESASSRIAPTRKVKKEGSGFDFSGW
jgi:hypothetical protein